MVILYIIAGIIALIIILGLIAPKNFQVEREILIKKSKEQVFAYIKLLKNQDNWSAWAKKDPDMKKEYRGTDGSVGFVSAWEGNKQVGKGEQEIKSIKEGERVDFELRFEKPWKTINPAYMITEREGDNLTKVKWGFSGKMPFPMNMMMLFMSMDKMAGKDFDEGLSNLKSLLER